MVAINQIIKDCKIGKNTKIHQFVNLYGCFIGNNSFVGPFVEIQKNVVIGNSVKIQSHSFICEGVVIEKNVFIGHHVVFTNDKYPRVKNLENKDLEWKMEKVVVKKGASIGSNSTIVGPVTIGENSMIGAGSVVTKNVEKNSTVAGNPARKL